MTTKKDIRLAQAASIPIPSMRNKFNNKEKARRTDRETDRQRQRKCLRQERRRRLHAVLSLSLQIISWIVFRRRHCRPSLTGPPWYRPDNDWPGSAGCRPWVSPAAVWRTAVAGRSSTARSWTCWRSSGTCPARRCTRWTESYGSPPDTSRDWTTPDRRPPLPPTCAVSHITPRTFTFTFIFGNRYTLFRQLRHRETKSWN